MGLFIVLNAGAQMNRQLFDFQFEGVTLNGLLNLPEIREPRGLILLVHGSGRTNAVAEEWYYDVRQSFVNAGYAVYMWDKTGCGQSGGTFNEHQPVHNSALEVISAINSLRENGIIKTEVFGLWGISRAGWVIPLVIRQYSGIKFWITVSGVDDKENFGYLLEQNLRINGHPEDTIDLLVGEWKAGNRISHRGQSFETYQKATGNLQQNKFWLRFTNGGITEPGYYSYQSYFMRQPLDWHSGLQIYLPDFESVLSGIDCPVLALFGEKDMNVDWQKTRSLYKKTIGQHGDLTIKTFPDGNHNLFQCNTGGFYELQDLDLPWTRCAGFLDQMTRWLTQKEKNWTK